MRYAGARHAGATEAKIAAINDDSSDLLSARERAAIRFAEKQTGTSAGPRTYARNPAVFKALAEFRGALARAGTIDPVLRELVRIKIAGLNACRY